MDTVQHDLDQAIPHLDPADPGLDQLLAAGRQAVRRRRARLGAALAGAAMAVGGVAAGVSVLLPQDGGVPAKVDRAATSNPSPSSSPRQEAPPLVAPPISLASLQGVVDECDLVSIESETGVLTVDGGPLEPTDQVEGEGWVAVEYPCGTDVIRVLQHPTGGMVARYPADRGTLAAWAEANAGDHGR